MEISGKLDILHQLYDIYDSFSTPLSVACVRGCAACCTQNVTMTTLEGYRIVEHLISTGQLNLFQRLGQSAHQERFQPTVTTNELAAICMQGENLPEEECNWPQAACPFLSNNECLIYLERPFGCRCFFSTQRCEAIACALVDPFLVTVNTVFLQFIEHIDSHGLFGNMTDILLFLQSETQQKRYEINVSLNHLGGLSVNRSIPALLVPREHQLRIQPILQKIDNIGLPQGSLGNQRIDLGKNKTETGERKPASIGYLSRINLLSPLAMSFLLSNMRISALATAARLFCSST
jgi:Fe-S-cluster containining protein